LIWEQQVPSREDEFYALATREVAESNLVTSAWGKEFSAALGDRQVALALYIKFRVEQLERDYQEGQQAAQQAALEEERKREAKKDAEDLDNMVGGCGLLAVFGALGTVVWLIISFVKSR
jgi:hypothetical protein